MDLATITGRFDTTSFDVYNSDDEVWDAIIYGQIHTADEFITAWNRMSVRRTLSVTPDNELPDGQYTIRECDTEDVFIVGQRSRNYHNGSHYKTTYVIQAATKQVTVLNPAPGGPSNDPGFILNTDLGTFYGDIEFVSQAELEGAPEEKYAQSLIMLTADATAQRGMLLQIDSQDYDVENVYIDAGFLFCRVTDRPLNYINVQYTDKTLPVYDPATGEMTSTDVVYDVTAELHSIQYRDIPEEDIKTGDMMLSIRETWIGIDPKIHDTILYDGDDYTIQELRRDSRTLKWMLKCRR